MIRVLAAAFLALASCGGGHAAPAHPAPAHPEAATPPSAATPPTDADCDGLVAHAVELGVAEQRAGTPPDRVATDDQQAKLRADLRAQFAPACRHMPRTQLRCALAATTLAAMTACDQSAAR